MGYRKEIETKKEILNKKNTDDLIKNIDNPYYTEKINSFVSRNSDLGITADKLKEEILNGNSYAISLIRKDPTRQNVSEEVFFDYVGIPKTPQNGKNAIRFGESKAADFKINDWYGTQKFIMNAGGAQDNQIADAITFAKEGSKAGKKVIVCVDGDYGEQEINKYLTNSDNLVITTADKLKEDIKNGRYN